MSRGVAVLLVLALAATAAAVSVSQSRYPSVSGEVVAIDPTLALLPGGVAQSVLGVATAGASSATAVELAATLATASPGVAAGRYAYTATVQEATVGSVGSGTFRAELSVDGASKGVVWFRQAASELLVVEGVTLVWDVGEAPLAGAAVYEVVVQQV